MKYELNHLTTCTSDYFSGHHLDVVQIGVRSTTTYGDIKNMMKDFYYAVDHIEDIDLEVYAAAVDTLFESITDLNAIPTCCSYIEPISADDYDDYEEVYMFFSLGRFSTDELDDVYVKQLEYVEHRVTVTRNRVARTITITDINNDSNSLCFKGNDYDTIVARSDEYYSNIECITREEANMLAISVYVDKLV